MSTALYHTEGLRFWSHEEIVQRENCVRYLETAIPNLLKEINRAWDVRRIEGPILTPGHLIAQEHLQSGDVYKLDNKTSIFEMALRAETTKSSYAYLEELLTNTNDYNAKLPLCVYQVGKSFRTENSDGATAAKLRFNEFYQMEFQCAYSLSTKKNYFEMLPDIAVS